jgi:predicted P-loop ATPase
MNYISIFPNGHFSSKTKQYAPATVPIGSITFEDYIKKVRDGEWQDDVLAVRNGKLEKGAVRGVTASGVFTKRKADGLSSHSGIIALDFDANMNGNVDMAEVFSDEFAYAGHESISGNGGFVLYVRIDPEKHLEAYHSLEAYFANKYGAVTDPSCKDVSRYRFVSFDPNAFINPEAKVFKRYLPKKKVVPRKPFFVHTKGNMAYMIEQIQRNSINVLEDYHDWMRAGIAFANEYGESGREYFHVISSYSSKYDQQKTDKAYDAMLRTGRKENTIGTVYWFCKNAGIKIKTETAEYVEKVAKGRILGGVKNVKESVKKLMEMEGIEDDEAELIVESLEKTNRNELKPKDGDDLIEGLIGFLSTFDLKMNVITQKIEINGEAIHDTLFSKTLMTAWRTVGSKVSENMLHHLIRANAIEYNPVTRFFLERQDMKPKGEIEKLFNCIRYDMSIEDAYVSNYLEVFMQKWLLSVVASAFGTHSEMMLVFIGGQGQQKTKFFRGLLPEELRDYYAESKLDDGKDAYTLMCEKLLIMDDEFGGKNKQEAKQFKDIISKSGFSVRRSYGRYHEDRKRLAVLAGTSNEYDVINDPTGNRRILPVNIVSIDKERFDAIDKDKLWMELFWKWKEVGNGWMLTKEEIEYLNRASEKNTQIPVELEAIQMYFDLPDTPGLVKYLTNAEIISYIESRSKLKINYYKIGVCMKQLGFEKKTRRIGTTTKVCYAVIEKSERHGGGVEYEF